MTPFLRPTPERLKPYKMEKISSHLSYHEKYNCAYNLKGEEVNYTIEKMGLTALVCADRTLAREEMFGLKRWNMVITLTLAGLCTNATSSIGSCASNSLRLGHRVPYTRTGPWPGTASHRRLVQGLASSQWYRSLTTSGSSFFTRAAVFNLKHTMAISKSVYSQRYY